MNTRCSVVPSFCTEIPTFSHITHSLHILQNTMLPPTLGCDDEIALKQAIKSNFPNSTVLVRARHLKQNFKQYMTWCTSEMQNCTSAFQYVDDAADTNGFVLSRIATAEVQWVSKENFGRQLDWWSVIVCRCHPGCWVRWQQQQYRACEWWSVQHCNWREWSYS